jgi:hypothetical protein
MNKLIHFLQQGRLVNIHSFSVNTIASVLKQGPMQSSFISAENFTDKLLP